MRLTTNTERRVLHVALAILARCPSARSARPRIVRQHTQSRTGEERVDRIRRRDLNGQLLHVRGDMLQAVDGVGRLIAAAAVRSVLHAVQRIVDVRREDGRLDEASVSLADTQITVVDADTALDDDELGNAVAGHALSSGR